MPREPQHLFRKRYCTITRGHSSSINHRLNGVVAVFSQTQGTFMGYLARNLSKPHTPFPTTRRLISYLAQYGTTPLTMDTTKVAFVKVPSAPPLPHFDLAIYNASYPYLAVIEGY